MSRKRQILEAISRATLLDVARTYEITGLTALQKAEIVDTLAGSRSVQPEDFLTTPTFSRDDLKAICRELGLDDSGREKAAIVDRILGRESDDDHAPSPPVARAAAPRRRDIDEMGIEDYRHSGVTRKNIPPAKIAAEGDVPEVPKIQYSYSPRRQPELRFDPSGKADRLPEVLEKAKHGPLTAAEAQVLAQALRVQQPWLEWAGKQEAEAKGFTVDPVALHIHERISAQAILKVAARQDVERTLFSDPEQDYHEAVQFYKHDIDWTNRLILGDSLEVMASLAHREDLAGKVQMIYMDPPYGIRFGSNFQPEVGRRDVKDKESDLTRELETVKAYRDIWQLGIHSYLTYMRQRLLACRELLKDTGSIFVQIGDENVHLVRSLLEEVFGRGNFVACISYKTSIGLDATFLDRVTDHILWFARDIESVKYHQLYKTLVRGEEGATRYSYAQLPDHTSCPTSSQLFEETGFPEGTRFFTDQGMTSRSGTEPERFDVFFEGNTYRPKTGKWRTNTDGMRRIVGADRILKAGSTIRFKKFFDDFGAIALTNFWADVGGGIASRADPKVYVVQTGARIIQRCMTMTTDPGDLVLDPTCGSGTTAYVAEQWGRRWIATDTSRVAVSIARQRLLTARFDYYELNEASCGVTKGLKYKTVPHITLRSIVQNHNLDPIFAKHEPKLDACLRHVNDALAKVTADIRTDCEANLIRKQKAEGKKAITDADTRRWLLPKKGDRFEHWTVPFDTDADWPRELTHAVTEYRKAWRAKMDEVNACIAANAAQEELVDQPEVVKGVTRVSGPFTVEAVQPPEQSIGINDGLFDGAPEQLEDTFDLKNVDSYLDEMTRLLRMDGVRFPNNRELNFSRLQRLTGQSGGLHAEGRWHATGETDDDSEGRATVAVGFGPQYGPVTAKQVEDLIRSASRQGYDALVVAGFSFDGPAQAVIEESTHPKLKIHMAHIRPDINPGMSGLLKEQPGAQLFTVFGQPRTILSKPDKNGEYTVTMEGVDIYDPVTNTTRATGADKVAAWFLDGDYDGRTFCITQAFFPDKSAWEKLAKALGGVVSEDAFDKLSGNVSLPFPRGKHKCCAVKVIDPRGNEVMQVHKLD
jgi:adenine-specific DNA-methyltransferase